MLNREQVFGAIGQAIAAHAQTGELLGLMIVRLHRLREYALLFGYEAAECAARSLQAAIVASVRDQDRVMRMGESDFAVLLTGLRNPQHAALAAAKLVRTTRNPLDAGGRPMHALVSVGIALWPDDAADAGELCRRADMASDDALAEPDRYAFYRAPEQPPVFSHHELREAIAGNHLRVHLQPLIGLCGDDSLRAESLSRWSHPQAGAIPPDVFVRAAEQAGLIDELTRWNINATLRHAAAARDRGLAIRMSINLSVQALAQPGFIEQLGDLLRVWSIPPQEVMLEVTESALMADLQVGARLLGRLRDLGLGVAIDDFGTGYSSMAYLRRLPLTELKIDRSFVLDIGSDVRAEKLVASMIDLSHHLGMVVAAEGVEDAATLERLRELGCDYAQGYHIGRPRPAEEVIAAMARQAAAERRGA